MKAIGKWLRNIAIGFVVIVILMIMTGNVAEAVHITHVVFSSIGAFFDNAMKYVSGVSH